MGQTMKDTVGTYNIVLTFSGLDERYTVDEYVFTVVITDVASNDTTPTPANAE